MLLLLTIALAVATAAAVVALRLLLLVLVWLWLTFTLTQQAKAVGRRIGPKRLIKPDFSGASGGKLAKCCIGKSIVFSYVFML